MEISDLIMVNMDQLEWISNEKKNLESKFKIKINFPLASSTEMSVKDIIFISICGVKSDIEEAKKKMFQTALYADTKNTFDESKNVPLVTLSDSEDDEINVVAKNDIVLKKARLDIPKKFEHLPDFIPIWIEKGKCKKRKKVQQKMFCKSTVIAGEDERLTKHFDRSPNCEHPPQVSVPKLMINPAMLRPIIIDASNVARAHGQQQTPKTFSCKGIKICVQYFLKRNHSVKAFIPNNMRFWTICHDKNGRVVTITDQQLLEEMYESGHVVFTPCRNVQGKLIVCYDDRFMINYASETGGVIVSNDNYRDLMGESEIFKKTIEERLLMFCFANDVFMPAQDPLGRAGPNLDTFLLFPAVEPAHTQQSKAPQEQNSVAKEKVVQKKKRSCDEINTLPKKTICVNKTSKSNNLSVSKDKKDRHVPHRRETGKRNHPIDGNLSVQFISSGEEDVLPGDESVLILDDIV